MKKTRKICTLENLSNILNLNKHVTVKTLKTDNDIYYFLLQHRSRCETLVSVLWLLWCMHSPQWQMCNVWMYVGASTRKCIYHVICSLQMLHHWDTVAIVQQTCTEWYYVNEAIQWVMKWSTLEYWYITVVIVERKAEVRSLLQWDACTVQRSTVNDADS